MGVTGLVAEALTVLDRKGACFSDGSDPGDDQPGALGVERVHHGKPASGGQLLRSVAGQNPREQVQVGLDHIEAARRAPGRDGTGPAPLDRSLEPAPVRCRGRPGGLDQGPVQVADQ